jgi:Na+/alanine symporter
MKLDRDTTLLDRLALGFFNAILSFFTGLVVWLGINGLISSQSLVFPFEAVLWFTLLMALLGMFVHDALLTILYARIWRLLVAWFRHY